MNVSEQSNQPLKIIPLGGLGEIGLNMMVFEYEDTIVLVDAGVMFPEDYMLGIDMVIPDIAYLRKRTQDVAAIVLTHGHEDHIGALPFVLPEINAPIYGTRLTLALVTEKLKEWHLEDRAVFNTVHALQKVTIGPFEIEFIPVCHSISDGVGLAIKTPVGIIVHSGDFKIDSSPVAGERTDLNRFSFYGAQGVLALLSDSTNVEREGYTLSEQQIGETIKHTLQDSNGRIIVAVFASNIPRIQQIVNLASQFERKIFLNGKSMLANVRIARQLGYLDFPEEMEIGLQEMNRLPDKSVLMLTTGSQGEPLSALTRMALDHHRQLRIKPGDTVILSSKFIPGNEKTITNIINNLYRRGAEVLYEKVSEIHVSGHANQEELKLMLNITRPRYFVPIHGEYRHLVKHIQLAASVGIPTAHLLLAENGDVIEFNHNVGWIKERIEVGRIFVDGKGVGDVGDRVLRDRRHLSEDGLVVAVVVVDKVSGDIVSGPDITSLGFVLEKMKTHILDDAALIFRQVLETATLSADPVDWGQIKNQVQRHLKRFFFFFLERRPVILPFIIEL
jgi:ribonuclease J